MVCVKIHILHLRFCKPVDTLLGYYEQGQYLWQLVGCPKGLTDALESVVIVFQG